jgi:FixJ family two-component response regulator
MIFRLRFAAHSAVERHAGCAPGRPALSSPPVVSIIDDDGSVRAATDNLVRSLGYVVHTFASAEEFLASPHLHDTSCVIADVQMPTMSGLELQAGATCFLAKPFAGEALINCLETALQGGLTAK